MLDFAKKLLLVDCRWLFCLDSVGVKSITSQTPGWLENQWLLMHCLVDLSTKWVCLVIASRWLLLQTSHPISRFSWMNSIFSFDSTCRNFQAKLSFILAPRALALIIEHTENKVMAFQHENWNTSKSNF